MARSGIYRRGIYAEEREHGYGECIRWICRTNISLSESLLVARVTHESYK